MYSEIFNKCINVILENEGGYVNHPKDPGGETNMGITKRNYPDLDIKNLTKEKAVEIYYKDYWVPMNLEQLKNDELILQVFDMGVNAGIRTGIKLLQRMVGTKDDGYIGTHTLFAVNNFGNNIVDEYKKKRKLFYTVLAKNKPSLTVFLNGWLKRVDHTKF